MAEVVARCPLPTYYAPRRTHASRCRHFQCSWLPMSCHVAHHGRHPDQGMSKEPAETGEKLLNVPRPTKHAASGSKWPRQLSYAIKLAPVLYLRNAGRWPFNLICTGSHGPPMSPPVISHATMVVVEPTAAQKRQLDEVAELTPEIYRTLAAMRFLDLQQSMKARTTSTTCFNYTKSGTRTRPLPTSTGNCPILVLRKLVQTTSSLAAALHTFAARSTLNKAAIRSTQVPKATLMMRVASM